MIKPYKATGLITHCYVCNTDLTYDDSDIVNISTQAPPLPGNVDRISVTLYSMPNL